MKLHMESSELVLRYASETFSRLSAFAFPLCTSGYFSNDVFFSYLHWLIADVRTNLRLRRVNSWTLSVRYLLPYGD